MSPRHWSPKPKVASAEGEGTSSQLRNLHRVAAHACHTRNGLVQPRLVSFLKADVPIDAWHVGVDGIGFESPSLHPGRSEDCAVTTSSIGGKNRAHPVFEGGKALLETEAVVERVGELCRSLEGAPLESENCQEFMP